MATEKEVFQRWLIDTLEQFLAKRSEEKALEQFRGRIELTEG